MEIIRFSFSSAATIDTDISKPFTLIAVAIDVGLTDIPELAEPPKVVVRDRSHGGIDNSMYDFSEFHSFIC